MWKRVYKFQSADYGISNLEKKRLKVTKVQELNDPFDLCPVNTTNPAISAAIDFVISNFNKKMSILCFSRNWDNLLLWSHYGNSHGGICLGFDVPESVDHNTDVLYQPNLLQIRSPEDINFDLANRLLRTKHESWSYEQEVRTFVSRNDSPDANGLNWIEFGPSLVLKEVIIGAQCDPAKSKKVELAVAQYGGEVKCWWAGMRSDAFLLIKQDRPPHWYEKVRSTLISST